MRDDFSTATKELLAKRVGHQCSNPECRQPTSGPQQDSMGAINVGVAAHITAASPAGPRYDATLSSEQRSSVQNGIWVCQTCGKLVDNDQSRYSVSTLKEWKYIAERIAILALEHRRNPTNDPDAMIIKAARLAPGLLAEIRKDLVKYPLRREFVVLKKSWSYWAKGNELFYFYEDHPELDSVLQVFENLGLVQEITYNNTKRFLITERMADYLTEDCTT